MKTTTHYSQFKLIKGNRPIDESHVKQLMKSISRENMLFTNPIIVNMKGEIIDGQHRLEVAKRLKLEVPYIELENADLKEVQILNANMRPWKLVDYLESYISLGFSDYIVVKNYMKRYSQSLKNSLILLCSDVDSKKVAQMFKGGTYKVTTREEAEVIGEQLLQLQEYMKYPQTIRDREFIRALKKALKNVPFEKIIRKLEIAAVKIDKLDDSKQYLRHIEDILNFKTHAHQVRLY